MAGYDVDLFVIGAGSGGVRASRIAAGHGARVMVAEEHRIGGTCVIRGCVPKKLYVYASRYAAEFEEAAGFGWEVPEPRFDFGKLKAAKDREIVRLEAAYGANLERSGAQAIASRAVIEDAHTVRLLADGRRITAERILVAVGAHPFVPEAMKGCDVIETSNDIFEWESLPKSVVIAGGGYIAVEFACLLARLGSDVTLVLRADKVLRGFDEDLRDALMAQLPFSGVRVVTQAEIASIDGRIGNLAVNLTNDQSIACERVVYATGRVPNTAGLGLEAAGVELDVAGAIRVDRHSQSTAPSIFAVGDVTNRVNLTPVAIREGHAFADTVYGGRPTEVDHALVPSAVFTTPEIGSVGLSEAQARARCEITLFKTSFRQIKATLSGSQERTFMKIIVEKATDRVLGVHIMGEGAGEMIQCVGIAVRMGATKRDFDMTMAVHPTSAEELVTMRTPWEPPVGA